MRAIAECRERGCATSKISKPLQRHREEHIPQVSKEAVNSSPPRLYFSHQATSTMVRPQLSPVAVPEAHGKGGRPHATPPRSLQRHPSPICRPFCDSAAPPAPHLCLCTRCRGAVETWRRRYGRFFRRMSRCGSCSRSQPLGHPGALQRARVPLPPCAFLRLRWFVVLPGLHPDGGGYGGG